MVLSRAPSELPQQDDKRRRRNGLPLKASETGSCWVWIFPSLVRPGLDDGGLLKVLETSIPRFLRMVHDGPVRVIPTVHTQGIEHRRQTKQSEAATLPKRLENECLDGVSCCRVQSRNLHQVGNVLTGSLKERHRFCAISSPTPNVTITGPLVREQDFCQKLVHRDNPTTRISLDFNDVCL